MKRRIILSILLVLAAQFSLLAQKTVKGHVADEKGEAIIGASALINGTKQGTVTDINGDFTMELEDGQTLEISCIGYQTKLVTYNGQPKLSITLAIENAVLDEVVVVGYGSMKKKEMTSAISHVAAKDLNKISTLDTKMLLQGKVSGLTVSNTNPGDPNEQASVQIRGISSRSAGLEPLYVVDGVIGADMTNINPIDIESIDVLKDGAASAIYGTRGGNGVIIVNLKKGERDGKFHTNFSASFSLNTPKKELEMLNAEQYRLYRTYNNPSLDLGSSTDWFDAITRIGYQQIYTLSMNGGNSKSNYRVTFDFRDARGVDLRSTRREYGLRLGANHTTHSGLFSFSANCSPRLINRDEALGFGGIKNNPTAPVYDPSEANGFYHFPAGGSGTNNVEQAAEITSNKDIFIIEYDVSAQINLLPLLAPAVDGMALTSRLTFSDHPVNKFGGSYTNSTYSGQMNSAITGSGSRDYDLVWSRNLEWVNNYSYTIKNHHLRVMAGYSYSYGTSSGLSASNSRFDSDATTYNDLGSGLEDAKSGIVGISTYKSDHKLIAFFGRINYDWKERYLLSVSLRHEGSSRFGENHKWGDFPAVSVGWRLSDESFMDGVQWIDDLKLRYDFGVTGNQDFGNYLSLSKFRSFGWYEYQGQKFKVWGPSSNVNSELRWEKGYNQNAGLDFSLLQYRINGSLNFYYRRQVDLLGSYSVPVPPNLFSTIYANVGTMRNMGFEFDLNFIPIRNDKLTWTISFLGATNDNIFESFSNDVYKGKSYYNVCEMSNPNNPGYLQRIEEGKRVGNYYTFRYAGVDNDGDWLIYDAHDNVIPISQGTEEDKTITGNGLPWFTGSISTTFNFGRFDAGLSFRFATGYEIFNVHDFYYGLQNMTTNVLTSAYARNAHITTGSNVISDYFLEPGDYIKLDNVTFGYTQPFDNKYIHKLRVFVNANNLYTFTAFTGVDPSMYEVNGLTPGTFGGSNYYSPSVFQCTFGLQVEF